MTANITTNHEHNGVEIQFTERPDYATREELRAAGFRWHKARGVWYAQSTPERLELAGKISRECGNGRALADQSRENAKKKLTAEDLPGASFVDGGGLYDGWEGGNRHKWQSREDLKRCLSEDFKRAGLRATFRFPRCGYLVELVVSLSLPASAIRPYEEWRPFYKYGWSCWNSYRDDVGNLHAIHGQNLLDMTQAEQDEIVERCARFAYDATVVSVQKENTHRPNEEQVLTEEAQKALDLAKRIVSTYNRDCTNSMVDYFDRAIYDNYRVKLIA